MLALGPFKSFHPKSDDIVSFVSASELHPTERLDLESHRIIRVYRSGNRYYVIYDSDDAKYRPYLASIPGGAEELDRLVYVEEVVKCLSEECPVACRVDPYEPGCEDYVIVKREEVVVWEKPGREPVNVVEGEPRPEDLVAWRAVTERNVEPVVKRLVDWSGFGWSTIAGRTRWPGIEESVRPGRVIDRVELENPFIQLSLLEDAVLETSDYDYCCDYEPLDKYTVVLTFRGRDRTLAFYKTSSDYDTVKTIYVKLSQILKPYEKQPKHEHVGGSSGRARPRGRDLLRELLSRLPGWADGFYVKVVALYDGEEGDVDAEVYPVKRSRYGDGWYYSPSWRKLAEGHEYLSIGHDVVVTRDGRRIEVVERRGRSKYVTLVPRTPE